LGKADRRLGYLRLLGLAHAEKLSGVAADWYRLFLVEIYVQIISGNEKLAPLVLLRNFPAILKVMIIASSRIPAVMDSVFNNPHFQLDGHFIGRGQMLLGLF
jgi:hypothetical protein